MTLHQPVAVLGVFHEPVARTSPPRWATAATVAVVVVAGAVAVAFFRTRTTM